MEYCRVIVDGVPFVHEEGFTYHVPSFLQEMVKIGCIVYIPFGKGNGVKKGIVINEESLKNLQNTEKIKDVLMMHMLSPVVDDKMMGLCHFVSDYYACAMIYTLKQVIPKYIMNHTFIAFESCASEEKQLLNSKNIHLAAKACKEGKWRICAHEPYNEQNRYYYLTNYSKTFIEQCINNLKRAPKQKEIFQFILRNNGVKNQAIKENFGQCKSAIQALLTKKFIIESDHALLDKDDKLSFPEKQMTALQEKIFQALQDQVKEGIYHKSLINGVTGSGKTLIYEKIIDVIIEKNAQALFLVPEIALSQHLFIRLNKRFGDRIALLHSQLTERERYTIWKKVAAHEIDVILGPRSALFLPFDRLGVIIIDEEHESSYKQSEPDPRYHAVKIAEYLAKRDNALLILGSATPSIESLYEVVKKQCSIFNLPERVNQIALPDIKLVDMIEERKKGNYSILSDELRFAIQNALTKNEQVILLINRKGYSSSIVCHECGEVIRCPKCDIPLTYYQSSNELKCNYCEFHLPMVKQCPSCGSSFIEKHGTGTETVESECAELFPNAKIDRLDAQSMMNSTTREQILKKYASHNIDILVGTQLLAKGLDFMNTTCIGVIHADLTLNLPDFRSAERCFQLMVQVAGRAGRDKKPSVVFIQTYQKNHYAMKDAKNQNVHQFFLDEIAFRKQWLYPPFVRLCRIIVMDYDMNDVEKSMSSIYNYIERLPIKKKIIGPSFAPISKKNNRYRMHLIIKVDAEENISSFMKKFRGDLRFLKIKNSTRVLIDIDPENIF